MSNGLTFFDRDYIRTLAFALEQPQHKINGKKCSTATGPFFRVKAGIPVATVTEVPIKTSIVNAAATFADKDAEWVKEFGVSPIGSLYDTTIRGQLDDMQVAVDSVCSFVVMPIPFLTMQFTRIGHRVYLSAFQTITELTTNFPTEIVYGCTLLKMVAAYCDCHAGSTSWLISRAAVLNKNTKAANAIAIRAADAVPGYRSNFSLDVDQSSLDSLLASGDKSIVMDMFGHLDNQYSRWVK